MAIPEPRCTVCGRTGNEVTPEGDPYQGDHAAPIGVWGTRPPSSIGDWRQQFRCTGGHLFEAKARNPNRPSSAPEVPKQDDDRGA